MRIPDPFDVLLYCCALALGIAAIGSGVQCAIAPNDDERRAIQRCIEQTEKPVECKEALSK